MMGKKPLSVDDTANFILGALDTSNSDFTNPGLLGSEVMSLAPGYENAVNIGANGSSSAATNVATLTLSINDTTDHVINATEATDVAFTVSGLTVNETAKVTFTDAANHQVVVNVGANGSFSANLSALDDGTITSSLSATGPAGQTATANGNAVALDTDSDLAPTMTVHAANPANVAFTIGGLEGDETGTVTFTDTTGHSDVVNIASNGTYSANLSNLANGTLTYLVAVTDPVGNVTTFDPTAMLGDGSANAPAGTPQLPTLFSGETVRPTWMVAGVDYAVGIPTGTVLKDWQSLSGPGISNKRQYGPHRQHQRRAYQQRDFSLHGGAILYINNSNDTVVTNCNFQWYNSRRYYNA